MNSAEKGHLSIVKYLIEDLRVNPNETAKNGQTALIKCCYEGHLEVAIYLIENGKADPHICTKRGGSPLLSGA